MVENEPFAGPLGALELQVMEIVWRDGDVTARDVCDSLKGPRARAYTTIMTTMDRLFHKGLLRRDKDGTAWRYAAAMTRDGWERAVASALAARIVDGGDVGLAAFVDAAADGQVLDRLAALIEQRRR